MKILFAADVSLSVVLGGAERVLFEQTRRLAERGHTVSVMTRRLSTHTVSQEAFGWVTEWRYHTNLKHPAGFLLNTIINGRELFDQLQDETSFDVINFFQPFTALPVVLSKKAKKIKKVYTCHSLAFEEFQSRSKPTAGALGTVSYLIQSTMRKRLEKEMLKQSEKIVVLSRYSRERLARFHGIDPERVRIIAGGVDLVKFHPGPLDPAFRSHIAGTTDRIVLLTVRNLVPRMGLEALISALPAVVRKYPEVILIIGGQGPLRESLIRKAAELDIVHHVKFTGFIPEEQLPIYYQSADLFILPTRELEGFGLVTLEALASGLPVLGTPVGGTLEILREFDPGFLFSDTSSEAIAKLLIEKLRRYRSNPSGWQRLKRACRHYAESRFDWERNIEEMELVYAS